MREDLTAIRIEYEKNGVPLSQFNVNRQGYVLAAYGVAEGEPIARLGLANFDNPAALEQLETGHSRRLIKRGSWYFPTYAQWHWERALWSPGGIER